MSLSISPETMDIQFEELVDRYNDMVRKLALEKVSLTNLDFSDLYNVGLEGLWKAKLNYLPNKSDFTTYAHHCINGYILNAINREKETSLSLSRNATKRLKTIEQYKKLKDSLGWTWDETIEKSGISEEKWKEVFFYSSTPISLNSYLSENRNEELITLIPGELGFEEKVIAKEEVNDMLTHLDSLEKQIIQFRYLEGYNKSQSAKKLNMPNTTFQRKEEKTLNKLLKHKDLH